MKKIFFILFCILSHFTCQAQTIEQSFLIDFGSNDNTNGNTTVNPDANSNYWNNIFNPFATGTKLSLFNSINTGVAYELEVTNQLASNGILNGGLLVPDPLLLGNYAINTVTEDYFFTDTSGSITFSSLNTERGYRFKIFGSRNTTENRESRYDIDGFNSTSGTLQTSGPDIGGNGYHGNNSNLYVSDIIFPNCNGEIKITITKHTNSFAYINFMEVIEYNDANAISLDNNLIAIMGSSVANGQGADINKGYMALYNTLLKQRFNDGDGFDWGFTNISIPGNNTLDVLNRWDCDLLPELSKYVIYGLSLWNEGIHDFGQPKFNQFRDNLQLLISNAEAKGKTPIIMNCYPNNNYNATDYDFIKEMNLLIHQWDVPSINLLGAIDDTTGKWVTSYNDDASHPNNLGHSELFYAIAPSLFDALNLNKTQPQKINNTYIALGSSISNRQLSFNPENIIHSFTNSFDIKTSSTGNIAALTSATGIGYFSINSSGYLKYVSPSGLEIIGSTIINDNSWHKITLTHYYAQNKTILYTDEFESGNLNEQLICDNFYLHPLNSPSTIDYKDWFFYRSAMSSNEIGLLNNGIMLKSSLELYAPLDGQAVFGSNPLINLAQSTNIISEEIAKPLNLVKTNKSIFEISPNPVKNLLKIKSSSNNLKINKIEIITNLGVKIITLNISNVNKHIDLKKLNKGLYFLVIHPDNGSPKIIKIVKK